MQLLVTGFGPFADISVNPSQSIVESLALEGLAGHHLRTEVFPVSYRAGAEAIQRLLLDERPDVALLLGVSPLADCVRLERLAFNAGGQIPDVDGAVAGNWRGATDILQTPVDVYRSVRVLTRQGYQVRVSADPGRYVCNHTYYAALHCCVQNALPTRTLFAHVPLPQEQSSLEAVPPQEGYIASVEALIRALVEHLGAEAADTSEQARNT